MDLSACKSFHASRKLQKFQDASEETEDTSAAAAAPAEDTQRCTSPDLYNRAALLCLRLLCRGTCLRLTSQTLPKEGRGQIWSKKTVF
jgi:hypothetical protein